MSSRLSQFDVEEKFRGVIDSIQILTPNFQKDYLLFDQSAHDNINQDKSASAKPNFVRSLDKIVNVCKSKNFDFNETNLVVLESEKDKADRIKSNMIELNVFS